MKIIGIKMSGRLFFMWNMLAAAKSRDDRDYNLVINAKARASFEPLLDLNETQFRQRYRISKKLFKQLCNELKTKTNLRSSQRVSIELKVCKLLFKL